VCVCVLDRVRVCIFLYVLSALPGRNKDDADIGTATLVLSRIFCSRNVHKL